MIQILNKLQIEKTNKKPSASVEVRLSPALSSSISYRTVAFRPCLALGDALL
jgi:hypothetical protein